MKVIWVVAALVAVTVFGSTEAKWKKGSCNNNITISDTDCNKYFVVANSTDGYEEGSLQLPVPNKLRGWRLVIGFSEELASLSLPDARSPKKKNKCGGRLFAFSSGKENKKLKAGKSLKIDYEAQFSKDLPKRPVVSFISFGNKRCSQECGKKPICPTKAPRTRRKRTRTRTKRPRTRKPTDKPDTTAEPENEDDNMGRAFDEEEKDLESEDAELNNYFQAF